MTKRAFGELELAVLNIVKSGKRFTVKHVHHLLGEKDKYTTIMTVMSRLAEKKTLAREKVGVQYEYWVLPSEKKVPSFIEQFKKRVFGFKASEMLSYLIESGDDITADELNQMEKMISKAKQERVSKKA